MSGDAPDGRRDADRRLKPLYEQARAAWPDVVLGEQEFAEHVAARVPAGSSPVDLHTDDLYLACACAERDPRALAAFEASFVGQATEQLARRYALPGFADELKQVLRERLLVAEKGQPPRIAGYTGRGPLAAWVRITATREAVDLRRKMVRGGGDELLPSHAMASPDPELDYLRRTYGDVVRKAIASALQMLNANDAAALRLFFLEGLKMKSIASVFQTSERTAQRMVANARHKILDETQRLLALDVGGSATQIESLIRLVRVDLGPSVVEILKKP